MDLSSIKSFFKFKKRDAGVPLHTVFHQAPTLHDILYSTPEDGIGALDLVCSYFASTSLKVYSARNKTVLDKHWFSMLIKSPNDEDIPFQFLYQAAKDYLVAGNVYIYIYVDYTTGKPCALFRLPAREVSTVRNERNQKVFTYRNQSYTSKQILHIPSRYGFDGTVGRSIFAVNAGTFDILGKLNDQLRSSTKAIIGDRPILDISERYSDVSDEQAGYFRDKFIKEYSGVENASKPIVVNKGVKVSSLKGTPLSQKDQQFFENRNDQKKAICELFGVPVGFFGGETNFDIESMHILLLDNAIRPLALSFSQYFNKLLDRYDFGKSYVEFNFNSLLRTSLQARIESYSKQLTNGMLSPNEIRELEGRPPTQDDSGDNLFIPSNIIPVRKEQIEAYLASSRLKLKEMEEKENLDLGDDKK